MVKALRLSVLLAAVLLLRAAAQEPLKVACVGDSITFGAGITDRTQTYPAQLQALLGDPYAVKNFGVSAATLLKKGDKPYWKLKAFQDATDFAPQIVILKLGTNDTKPQNFKFKEEFESDLGDMVDHFAGLPSKPKIFLCLPVPIYGPRFGIQADGLKFYMPVIQKVAEAKKAGVIDLFAALSDKADLFPDQIHPDAAGAKLIAEAVAAALKK